MICIGYDYGTTNSIISQYVNTKEDSVKILKRRTSAIRDGQTLVRSPKRLLSETPMDEFRATRYLYDFSKDIIQQALLSVPKTEPVFITTSVPNAYKDYQCKLMLDTLRQVGADLFTKEQFSIHSVSVIPEPIAAALYYVVVEADKIQPHGIVSVCDIGGGTTDLAVVKYDIEGEEGHKTIIFKVLCTAPGDDALGGDDIDAVIASEICSRYELEPSMYSEQTLNAACRALKLKLSVQDEHSVLLTGPDGIHPAKDKEGKDIVIRLTRKLLRPLLERYFIPKLEAQFNLLKKAFASNPKFNGNREQADDLLGRGVILPIGGTSQIPLLQEVMVEQLGMDNQRQGDLVHLPGEIIDKEGVAPYDSVARGAALYSAWLNNELVGIESIRIEGRTMHTISIEVNQHDLEAIVERNMPAGTYCPTKPLFPLMADPGGKTFRIKRIDLYEGEGKFVGDTRFGPAPQHLRSLSEKLERLDDLVYTHGRSLPDIPIEVQLDINEQGRLASLRIRIPEGRVDHSDYTKEIDFIR